MINPFANRAAKEADVAEQARSVAPVVWLLGKVQSGKSSIVHALTGASRAEVGNGFRPCTLTANIFELPPQAPVIRFLDTRGLGEAAYDPEPDLAVARAASHCTIAVMRAMDRQQTAVLDVLRKIRRNDPAWPIVVAQSHLHEGYQPGDGHKQPYPFDDDGLVVSDAIERVPEDLRRALAYQREQVLELPGQGPITFVPLDFTQEDDGFEPADYGLTALQAALARIGPAALAGALDDVEKADVQYNPHQLILGHAAAASAADLVPVAAIAAVPAVQARLLHQLGHQRGLTWTRRTATEFAGMLGVGALARYAAGFGIRQLTKLIPVYGQTAGAAAAAATSFATTYALGKAADYFLEKRRAGKADMADVQRVWAEALREAFDLAKVRGLSKMQPGEN